MILAPPPDLVVTSLNVSNNESVRTGDILVISYNVTNEGAGPSFETYWEDYVVSSTACIAYASTHFLNIQ